MKEILRELSSKGVKIVFRNSEICFSSPSGSNNEILERLAIFKVDFERWFLSQVLHGQEIHAFPTSPECLTSGYCLWLSRECGLYPIAYNNQLSGFCRERMQNVKGLRKMVG